MKIQKTLLAGIFLMTMLLSPMNMALASGTDNNLQAYGVDTIAGYSSLLSTSKTYPHQEVIFTVKKPDGSMVTINALSDGSGVAKANLDDSHTHRAGSYSVSAAFKNSKTNLVNYFNVYADEVSDTGSTLTASKVIAKADGQDATFIVATIKDQYGNPFTGHMVSLISSRNGDKITSSSNGITNSNGSATFKVSANTKGVSTYSAVDTTSGVVVTPRIQVGYLDASTYISDVGGEFDSFIPIAKAADSGSIYSFDITNLPSTIAPQENVSFTVEAKDQNNVAVENYTGTIHFSSEGPNSNNVTLPEDYTFKAEDLGQHEFSLGLKFTVAGTYKIVVTDINNQIIKGEKTVTVGNNGNNNIINQNGQKPSILSPAPGTFSQNIQTVSGAATPNITINIFDNDQQIGTTKAGNNGQYSYQTPPLADGKHSLYVVSVNEDQTVQTTSDTIEFIIDTAAPTVDDIEVTPTGKVKPGTLLTVKVMSEENLLQAAAIFNSDIIELIESVDTPGNYSGTIQAPQDAGMYPVDIVLVDQLNNEETYDSKASITVEGKALDGTDPVTADPSPKPQDTIIADPSSTTDPSNTPPSQVLGVIGYGSANQVTLVWEAAMDNGMIKNYRIRYGLDPAKLENAVDTKDASTTWYIPHLDNGKEYYFALTAIDDKGVESLTPSEIVSAIPFTLEVATQAPNRPTTALTSTQDQVLLHSAAIEQLDMKEINGEPGPEVLWVIGGSGVITEVARRMRKKFKNYREKL